MRSSLLRRAAASAHASSCPACGGGLTSADYEGVAIEVCPACGGRLASSGEVQRILARREVGFSDEQRRLADVLVAEGDDRRRVLALRRGHGGVELIGCPRCAKKMLRGHYDYTHPVEVDRCMMCDLLWFEKDELEVLQLLMERQVD